MKVVLVFCFVFLLSAGFAVVEETGSFKAFLYGETNDCEYDNWVSHIAEGIVTPNYNYYAPFDVQTNGFGDYLIATDDELTNWESLMDMFVIENTTFAQLYIDSFEYPYQIVEFHDTDSGETYLMLREIPNWDYIDNNSTPNDETDDEIGAFEWGWGLYLFNPESQNPLIITAPHPNDDFTTAEIAFECFQKWNARYLLISGAGREVKWTEDGNYTNSKSLSDPSRIENHPFTKAYKVFCDEIRDTFGRRELSVQVHGYDWSRHAGHPNLQLSAGYNRGNPNLPIRDLSDLRNDIINNSSNLIFAANTIGSNQPVYLNDYYGVYYNTYDFIFSDGENSFPVNNHIDLPGYSQNKQMLYTDSGWNNYDVFEPFFHFEMDELPDSYPQNLVNYRWFYGYDPVYGSYDMNHVFDNAIAYFSPFIDAVAATLPAVFQLNDELIPNIPQNLTITNSTNNSIRLAWDCVSSFDFETYEILYDDEPIINDEFEIFDRSNNIVLASPRAIEVEVTGLTENTNYYFAIRGRDYNGNVSETSNEVAAITSSAKLR